MMAGAMHILNSPILRRFIYCLGPCLLAGCAHLETVFNPRSQAQVAPSTKEESQLPVLLPERLAINLGTQTKTDPAKAAKTLEEITTRPPLPGVTDEALFRLALYNLRSATRESTGKAQQLLQRLAKEFPLSTWNQMGQPIHELLDALAEQRRQIAVLKNQNQNLTKESRELHLAIEQLKTLDLELEKKSRR
jgi:hypothetical protein